MENQNITTRPFGEGESQVEQLFETEVINKNFDLVMGRTMCYLKSKDEKFLIQPSIKGAMRFDIVPNSNNLNNSYVKKYFSTPHESLIDIDEEQVFKALKHIYDQQMQ